MNADYPANPAASGSRPFPSVTQAVPQGAGGTESATAPTGGSGSGARSQPGAGGDPKHAGAPAVPAPSRYASPASATGAAGPASPPQPTSHQHAAPTQQSAPQPGSTQPGSTQPGSTQPGSTQPGSTQPGSTQPGSTAVAPVRRASLRTGTQSLSTEEDKPQPKKFAFFGKKSDVVEASGTTDTLRRKGGPRKVRAMMTSIDPWSAMKMSFLTSIAAGIAFVVAVNVIWGVLNQMGVFIAIQDQVKILFDPENKVNILQYFDYGKDMSAAILVAVFNVVIMTALGTITALIYNVIAKLVGGVYVTLSDD